MTATDLIALLPLLVTGGTAVLVMLAIAVRRGHRLVLVLTALGLVAALAVLPAAAGTAPRPVTGLLIVDRYGLFLDALFLLAALAVACLAFGTLRRAGGRAEEFYLLLLIATFGAQVLVMSSHFASFVVGLETLGLAVVAMAAYPADAPSPLEAGLKYLILSGASSAFLLFGVALVYAAAGTLSFGGIGARLAAIPEPGIALAGFALVVAGVAFKLSLVPFHMWAPDVYQGAPAPVAAFVSTVSKGAVAGFLLRYVGAAPDAGLMVALSVLAALSMLAGNLLALLQDNVKRLLAYSSIAHLGYLLVALVGGGVLATPAVLYYLAGYMVMTLGTFAVIAALSLAEPPEGRPERDRFDDYRGLFWRRPWLAGAFAAALLALAGIPLTVGFVAKFFAVAAGLEGGGWPLVLILIAGSAIGLYYYLRLVVTLFLAGPAAAPAADAAVPVGWGLAGAALLVLIVALVGFGIFPGPILTLIHASAPAPA